MSPSRSPPSPPLRSSRSLHTARRALRGFGTARTACFHCQAPAKHRPQRAAKPSTPLSASDQRPSPPRHFAVERPRCLLRGSIGLLRSSWQPPSRLRPSWRRWSTRCEFGRSRRGLAARTGRRVRVEKRTVFKDVHWCGCMRLRRCVGVCARDRATWTDPALQHRSDFLAREIILTQFISRNSSGNTVVVSIVTDAAGDPLQTLILSTVTDPAAAAEDTATATTTSTTTTAATTAAAVNNPGAGGVQGVGQPANGPFLSGNLLGKEMLTPRVFRTQS